VSLHVSESIRLSPIPFRCENCAMHTFVRNTLLFIYSIIRYVEEQVEVFRKVRIFDEICGLKFLKLMSDKDKERLCLRDNPCVYFAGVS